ncbi:MAG: class I SAM-dependent methyltransferase [Candidatus Kerfeldbacteria bacterium]|nr:class I SAM-dependent methyltransferase [Candidatus Kerfeldbacteria bacterium]
MNLDAITEIVKRGYTDKEVAKHYGSVTEIWPEEKFIFDRFFKNVGHILDIGCGGGRTSFYLASLGNKVTAIDLSSPLIGAAKRRLAKEPANIEFDVKDDQHLGYPDNYFDGIIFSFNGIGYIARAEGKTEFLKVVRRMLKQDKFFFFTAHNLWSINAYFLGNILRVTKILFSKLFHINIREKEYGEKYDDTPNIEVPYIDIKPKRKWDEIIKQSEFKVAYFNSKYGIRDKRSFSLFKDYSGASNYLFFVLQK